MEKKCKFKVGDKVIGNSKASEKYRFTKKGYVGTVTDPHYMPFSPFPHPDGRVVLDKKWLVDEDCFDFYTPHEGKILIMVDEKDNDKIIARDLITGKTAEAKCNPKDEWDFNKGANLALERLTEPEKPKGWTGKVVCVSNEIPWMGSAHCVNWYFESGKVYDVIDGNLYYKPGEKYTGIEKVTNPKDLGKNQDYKCPVGCDFIEYKGEVTTE